MIYVCCKLFLFVRKSPRYEKRKKDYFYRKAKQQGYRSRASYKLLEIQKKFKVLKKGYNVVDLGAAPGGWLQVTSEIVGEKGKVIGIDLKPILPFKNSKNIITITGNAESPLVQKKAIELMGDKADVVLSDMAPDVTGNWTLDHSRQISLATLAFEIAKKILKEDGSFIVKVFMGEESTAFYETLKKEFKTVKHFRPKATRQQSAEEYFVCMGFKRAGTDE